LSNRAGGLNRRQALIAGGIAGSAALLVVAALVAQGDFTSDPQVPAPAPAASKTTRMLVLLPSQGLWFPDYQSLVDAAKETGATLVFASTTGEPSQVLFTSKPGVAMPDIRLTPAVGAKDYDGIIFIGYETGEFLPGGSAGEQTKRLIHEFQREKKIVASLCAGQRVLAQQGAVNGKRVAKCQSVKEDEIFYGGGTRTEGPVEIDGQLVTASHADHATEFLTAIAELARNP
jgi:putative intracellular protease/amidase